MLLRMTPLYRIGVDVGGTNTDAAILDIRASDSPTRGVLASSKTPTTENVTGGIETAIQEVIEQSGVDKSFIISVTIGTTHFINALLEADSRKLDRVAVFRLCGPYTRQTPPFCDFPIGLNDVLNGGSWFLDGGLQIDGRETTPLDPQQIRKAAREAASTGIKIIVVIGVYSSMGHKTNHEEECKRIILEEVPHLTVACSRDIGPPGFLERENATILNAAMLRTASKVIRSFRNAMRRLELACPLYLSQNDGTLIEAHIAAEYPVKTFANGTTNSMTGARFLCGIDIKPLPAPNVKDNNFVEPQLLVLDIGGTSTDCCSLLPSGFPRQSPGFMDLGGVRTSFSMPDVHSMGLGGGSIVRVDPDGNVQVGPSSVGYKLIREALVFGGQTLTATDIMVAAGKADIGDASLVKHIPQAVVERACGEIKRMLENMIDAVRVSMAPVRLLLVGGGSILVSEDLKGVEKCIKPMHQDAANAVGAAIAKISGEVDLVRVLRARTEADVLAEASKMAIDQAIEKGAAPDDIRIVEVHKTLLPYMSHPTARVRVRAVGRLLTPQEITFVFSPDATHDYGDDEEEDEGVKVAIPKAHESSIKPASFVDLDTYRPEVRDGAWYISEVDLELIATGCGVLGSGGGGSTHYEFVKTLLEIRKGDRKKFRVISPKSLKHDDTVYFGCHYGSPDVISERLSGGNEVIHAITTAQQIAGRPIRGVIPDEIGGGNGLCSFVPAAHFDVPVIDGDAMGRAYPCMHHVVHSVCGCTLLPCVITDASYNTSVVLSSSTVESLEPLLRTMAVQLGLNCSVSSAPLYGWEVQQYIIPNSVSLAWFLGRAIHQAKRTKTSYADAIFSVLPGKVLYSGKIVEVRRELGDGYLMGAVLIAPFTEEDRPETIAPTGVSHRGNTHMIIAFKNEFLYAAMTDSKGSAESEEVVMTIPDIISIIGADGVAIGTQDLRFGLIIHVVAIAGNPLWKTEKGMKVGGPEGFGLPMPHIGFRSEDAVAPRSVIEEFGDA